MTKEEIRAHRGSLWTVHNAHVVECFKSPIPRTDFTTCHIKGSDPIKVLNSDLFPTKVEALLAWQRVLIHMKEKAEELLRDVDAQLSGEDLNER